jgi:predicted ATP-grasp superfamily ATP-dependent carboligase
MSLDFTLEKYRELLQIIKESSYETFNVRDYLLRGKKPRKCVILRHDVDKKPKQALEMAEIEAEYNINSTFYFRMNDEVFEPSIIKQIVDLGHEVGYHYEVLDKAKGDLKKAIRIFKDELALFRELCDVKTVCMHGNPLTPWDNREIWNICNLGDFELIGEAYLSLDFRYILYLTDTGRSWEDRKYRVKDKINAPLTNNYKVKTTDDIIRLINNQNIEQICIVTHPQRWAANGIDWFKELILQNIKNFGKYILNYINLIKMKKNIDIGVIIIGDHIQALGIARSLGRRGIPIYLLNDNTLCITRFSRFCKKFIKCPNIMEETQFIDFMISIANKYGIEGWVLMPTNDAAVYILSKYKPILEKHYKVPTPSWDIVKFAYDKQLTYLMAEKSGICIPKTLCPTSVNELHKSLQNFSFPVIVKGRVGHRFYKRVGVKALRFDSKNDVIEYYEKNSSLIDPSDTVIQEIIPGNSDLVYSFCSFFKNGKFLGVWMGKKIREHPEEFGTATSAMSIFVPELIELGYSFLNAINFYGISEIEFKKDPRDGKFKMIEINARTWLWHSLAKYCGVDFPYLLYKDMLGEEIIPITSFKTYIKWIHFYTDIGISIKKIIRGNLKIRDYLESLCGEKEFVVFSVDDPLPFLFETLMLPYLWKTR